MLNAAFDYRRYLDELARHRLNQTRTFSGTYREIPESFGITDNTLSPEPGQYVAPWARSDRPGAADGLNKFDLDRFDERYFERLRDFVAEAGRRGVVVEYVLFCTLYNDKLWDVSPMNPKNVVNDLGPTDIKRTEVHALKHPKLQAFQEAFVRRAVTELNAFDNVYFEICNEPYFENVTDAWQARIAAVVAQTERSLPKKHLIAQNIANDKKKVDKLPAHVSILNFHYATPPETVAMNYHHNVPIADDETGFKGNQDVTYRTECWDFLVAGGAAYSNLDYSFTPKHPAGTLKEFKSPGGGGESLRRQLGICKAFFERFDFVKMKPADEAIVGGRVTVPLGGRRSATDSARAGGMTARCLAEPGKQYAIYLRGGVGATLILNLPAGAYQAEWLDTQSGRIAKSERIEGGPRTTLTGPAYDQDIALRIVRAE